ncbi:uncharacterized protein LOC126907435 [Daktulosphaira vitifoliae]|uniref:uncharacterized protein LOC126907435 n=1 Tax=Daktulosphaira vitifoliae TaxID=58002 RepID=UPI0021AA6250|nr:uncharacterized protein LOC126907435 [Daktulosphaira vitifoliae]
MFIKKVFLVAVFVILGSMFYSKASDDKEKLAKFISSGMKCFSNVNIDACAEMLEIDYDKTQQKYIDCKCALACVGKDFNLLEEGKAKRENYVKIMDEIQNATVKAMMKNIHDSCPDPEGADECIMAGNFMNCALKNSPAIKERITSLMHAVTGKSKQR